MFLANLVREITLRCVISTRKAYTNGDDKLENRRHCLLNSSALALDRNSWKSIS